MLSVGDTLPGFSLTAVKGGPAGLKLDSAFTEISDSSTPRIAASRAIIAAA